MPTTKHKIIKQVPLKRDDAAEPETDAVSMQKLREAQEAEAALYNSTRLLPTIQDPMIYSVRVRVIIDFFCDL